MWPFNLFRRRPISTLFVCRWCKCPESVYRRLERRLRRRLRRKYDSPWLRALPSDRDVLGFELLLVYGGDRSGGQWCTSKVYCNLDEKYRSRRQAVLALMDRLQGAIRPVRTAPE
jgi:hypothetical protein